MYTDIQTYKVGSVALPKRSFQIFHIRKRSFQIFHIRKRRFLWRSATIHYIVMYIQIYPVTSLLKSTMKQTYSIQSPLRISSGGSPHSETKFSNTRGNCPRSEVKLPDQMFTKFLRNFGTFGSERKAFKGINYSSDQANAQNQIVQSLDLGKVSQTLRVPWR